MEQTSLRAPAFDLRPSSRSGAPNRFTDEPLALDPAAFARTAAVVRNRRDVLDRLDVDPGGLDRPNRRLAAGARPRHPDVHGPQSVVPGEGRGVGRRELG